MSETQNIRRYEVGARIAAGGMAEVFAAKAIGESGLAKRVALKKILPSHSADPDFASRFIDEARLAMRLSHANIVQVFDFGRTDEDQYFLAMEFVEGVDLRRLLERGPLPPGEALHVAIQVLRGLDYAHRLADDEGHPLRIVHRDVKPANVLVSFEGEVKLLDFGIARSSGHRTPTFVGVIGTCAFMSPEQARGWPVDARSDVFSAATLLYLMATGVHPFEASNDSAVLARVREAAVEPPSRHGGSRELDTVILKGLAANPDERWPTAAAFADSLEEVAFAQGWRGSAALLARRVGETCGPEKERLSVAISKESAEALQVAEGSGGRQGTKLTHGPKSRPKTEAMGATQARPRWRLVAAGIAIVVAAAAGGVWVTRQPSHPTAPTIAELPPLLAVPEQPAVEIPPPVKAEPAVEPRPKPETPARTGHQLHARTEPKPAAVVAGEGTLTVNADPWGNVYVNGKLVKETPLVKYRLPAGPATVVVENPKLGRRVFDVRIEPGQDTPVIVDLRSGGTGK